MSNVHLIFSEPCPSCGDNHHLEIILQGTLQLSPYVEVNGAAYLLHGSYTHSNGTIENLYYPALTTHADPN